MSRFTFRRHARSFGLSARTARYTTMVSTMSAATTSLPRVTTCATGMKSDRSLERVLSVKLSRLETTKRVNRSP